MVSSSLLTSISFFCLKRIIILFGSTCANCMPLIIYFTTLNFMVEICGGFGLYWYAPGELLSLCFILFYFFYLLLAWHCCSVFFYFFKGTSLKEILSFLNARAFQFVIEDDSDNGICVHVYF